MDSCGPSGLDRFVESSWDGPTVRLKVLKMSLLLLLTVLT